MLENKKIDISVVIPVYNEEKSVVILYKEIQKYLEKITKNYEIIFINDGSFDRTQQVLENIKKNEQTKFKIIQFRRNFGKAEAYKAGFELCQGDLIFTMDGDLQDNPQDILKFIKKIETGYDIVIGWKYQRKDSLIKILISKFFNIILRYFTKLNLHDFDNGYRCFKKEVISYLNLYEGLYRYIPIFANAKGFKITEIKVSHRHRKFGKSKYGISKIFKGFFDLISVGFLFSYLKRPLHFFGVIGGSFLILGFIIGIYLSYLKLFLGQAIGSRPLLSLAILLIIIGIQFIFFGLLGEMIIYTNTKKEKNYSIKKII